MVFISWGFVRAIPGVRLLRITLIPTHHLYHLRCSVYRIPVWYVVSNLAKNDTRQVS